MSTVRKTITLTDRQNEWIKAQIESGAYTNDSEVVRDLIRKAQSERAEIDAVRIALAEAEASGVSNRTPEDIRTAVLKRRGDES